MTKILERVFRIGIQTLWIDQYGQYWMSIKNRTYQSKHPVPADRVDLWKQELSYSKKQKLQKSLF